MDKSIVDDSYLLFKFIKDVRHDKHTNKNGQNGTNTGTHTVRAHNYADDDSSVLDDMCHRSSVRSDSMCSYEDVITRRNSVRSSVVDDSDCMGGYNGMESGNELGYVMSYCGNEIDGGQRVLPTCATHDKCNIDKTCDRDNVDEDTYKNTYDTTYDINTYNTSICNTNTYDINTYNNTYVNACGTTTNNSAINTDTRKIREKAENQNLNEEMKKYFHKITSIRKKVFVCEYCRCKFVYKKCLVNHVEKNHFGKE